MQSYAPRFLFIKLLPEGRCLQLEISQIPILIKSRQSFEIGSAGQIRFEAFAQPKQVMSFD